jgi:hypothetical protein
MNFEKVGALVHGRRRVVEKSTDCENKVHAIPDQNGITYDGSSWTNAGYEFCEEFALDEPAQLLLNQWAEPINEFS